MELSSDIRVSLYQSSADVKNILEMMALGVDKNDRILIRASGEGEEEALEAIKRVLAQESDSNP